MISNQNCPFLDRFEMPDRLPRPSSNHPYASFGLPEGVTACVHRISQHVPNRVVDGYFPDQLPAGLAPHPCGQTYFLSTEPQQDLTRTSKLGHLRKDQFDRLLDSPIRIFFNLAICSPLKANRKRKLQFASLRLLPNRFLATLTEKVQLELAHRALQS